MGRFVRSRYSPKTESSVLPSTAGVPNPKRLEIVRGSGLCECGCRQRPAGKKSEFAMGHDARLRGMLIRAHLTDTPVALFTVTDAETWEGAWDPGRPARAAAERYGWEGYLDLAAEREERLAAEKLERANRSVLERAMADVGDRRLVKVGRWHHTGQVVAIWDDGATYEFQYVTKNGDVRTVRKPRAEVAGMEKVD